VYFWIAVGVSAFVPALWLYAEVKELWPRRKPAALTPDEARQADALPGLRDADLRATWASVAPAFILFIPLWMAFFWALKRGHLGQLPPSAFIDATPWFLWIGPALFLSLVTLFLLVKRSSDRRFRAVPGWTPGRWGVQGRVARIFVKVLVPLAFVVLTPGWTAGLMGWHVRFGEDEIGVQAPGWLRERQYTYAQVRHVVRSTNVLEKGAPKEQDGYYVVLKDGRVVEPFFSWRVDPDEGRRWAEFVCARTGKPLRVVQFPDEAMALAAAGGD
jgi:hypothetical protein